MGTAAAHYQTHLGPIYSWMLGDLKAAFKRSDAEIGELQLPLSAGRVAVDLGAGLGLHSIALANRGFHVTAIDNCQALLEELNARRGALLINTLNADLIEFPAFLTDQAQVIVCMGDTLTHLPTLSAVESLLASVARSLAPGGVFATTFRDYATATLQGDSRFILVRADAARILTCFLEYGDRQVTVHDLLHEQRSGQWHQSVSSYSKLRLAPDWIAAKLVALGLLVRRDSAPGGMVRIVATKL
jgi:2-polyprenyl-3-methyl-5-hydroxy-6-metoxy-1,4-benzoquinol methylase